MQVSIHEAKTHLSRLLVAVAQGEEVIIAKGHTPVASLMALPHKRHERQPGRLRGKVQIAPDFDAPLPAAVQKAFEG